MEYDQAGMRMAAVLEDNPIDQIHVVGDVGGTHLWVERGPLSMDSDDSWQRAQAYVREFGLQLLDEWEQPPGAYNPDYPIRVLFYAGPQWRLLSNDYDITKVIRAAWAKAKRAR
ncbi:hypothetical protein A5658_16075 [Mycobacterium sp. 1245111.1]|uniref:hypothetical protein n=1 Tax=Mycobacterium sp. 1245111.1 TaxID=1834073 RepID=UPI0007FFB1DD|nr:hypothetical protein [Mycobacterium sp. 1245111.1]OBK32552.1 hypothetical protein A5658_16075 [Mycobacterium sp. 1245111.1]